MTMKVYMADLLSAILHTIQDGKLLAQHPLTAEGKNRLCVYRCDDGYRCAIGCVLDDHYMKEVRAADLNGCGIPTLEDADIIAFPEGDHAREAARLLQNSHDSSLGGRIVFSSVAEPLGWMSSYSHLCVWFRDNRGKPSSLLMVQKLVQAMQKEDWGGKEVA